MTLLNITREGSGKPLVMVHGYLGGARLWLGQLDHFKDRFDVVVPELAGYGDSPDLQSHASIHDMATAILDTLTAQSIDTFYLVGHSMGGMIVQHMAFLAPNRVRKLVCFGTGPQGLLPNRFEPIQRSRERLVEEGVVETAKNIAAKWYLNGKQDPTYPLCLELSMNVGLETAQNGLTAMETWDGRENLQNISCPTLIIWGDHDRSYGWSQPEALWQGIANAALSVMANCGHNAHLEKPTIFNAILDDFLMADNEQSYSQTNSSW